MMEETLLPKRLSQYGFVLLVFIDAQYLGGLLVGHLFFFFGRFLLLLFGGLRVRVVYF